MLLDLNLIFIKMLFYLKDFEKMKYKIYNIRKDLTFLITISQNFSFKYFSVLDFCINMKNKGLSKFIKIFF